MMADYCEHCKEELTDNSNQVIIQAWRCDTCKHANEDFAGEQQFITKQQLRQALDELKKHQYCEGEYEWIEKDNTHRSLYSVTMDTVEDIVGKLVKE
jgi:hypothetical protein